MSKHFIVRHYLWIFLFLLSLIGAGVLVHRGIQNSTVAITLVGGVVSLFFGIQKKSSEDLQLFKVLFTEMNQKYDQLNDILNEIIAPDGAAIAVTTTQGKALNKYFNLCGEEYLFYRKGYIYPEVWNAWLSGMQSFYSCPKIGELWKEELESNSYYGLKAAMLERKR